jgi:hypothetical protein
VKEKWKLFKKKWENYWYHYTPHTLVVGLAAVLVFMFIFDMATQITYDLTIGYVGRENINYAAFEEDIPHLENAAVDVDENGEKHVILDAMTVKENIESEEDFALQQRAMLSFVTGEIRLYILEREYAESYAELFYPLDDIADEALIQDGVKYNRKTVAVSLRGNEMVKGWGVNPDNLYIAVVDIVPAHEKIKYIDKLFESALNGFSYIISRK